MARVFLFDTLFHIFRAFHALPPMSAPDGTPTNAVHGVINAVGRLWKNHSKVDGIALVFESMEGVFREDLDPDYKANRAEPHPDLRAQIPLVKEAARCLGIKTLEVNGFEADDVIATVARHLSEQNHDVFIVSNDKDMGQILRHRGVYQLKLAGTGKNAKEELLGAPEVEQQFGVPPHLVADWLALVGDSVDNIPGLKGVGPKTAAKLLLEWGSLERMLECADQIPKWPLIEQSQRLRLNLKLSQAEESVPLECTLEDFLPGPFQGLEAFYERLAMKRNLAALQQLFPPNDINQLWRSS